MKQSKIQNPKSNITQALNGKTIGFIGAGTMGQALLKGLVERGVDRRQLIAADANPQTRRTVTQRFRMSTTDDNGRAAQRADVIVLAIKPQQFPEMLDGLRSHVHPRALVISIAAGITLRWLQKRLPGIPLVRVMPNLPATVGCGFSALARGTKATRRHRAMARALFEAVGTVVELPERHFDAITAVSGSGPAYLVFVVQAWRDVARSLGLPEAIADAAIHSTVQGSLRLWQQSGESPDVLMQRVASKGGTTEAALRVLVRRRVAQSLMKAVRAAAQRSRQLAWS